MGPGQQTDVVEAVHPFRDFVGARWRSVTQAIVPLACFAVVVGGMVMVSGGETTPPASRPAVTPIESTLPAGAAEVLGVAITRPRSTTTAPPAYVPPPQVDLDGPELPDPLLVVRDDSNPGGAPTAQPGPPPRMQVQVVVTQPVISVSPPPTAPDPVTVTSLKPGG